MTSLIVIGVLLLLAACVTCSIVVCIAPKPRRAQT